MMQFGLGVTRAITPTEDSEQAGIPYRRANVASGERLLWLQAAAASTTTATSKVTSSSDGESRA